MNNYDFDKNGIDSTGTHWFQYLALVFSAFAIFTTWAYFFDIEFHSFILKIFRFLNCRGFNQISSYCIKLI